MTVIRTLLIEDNPADANLFGELLKEASFGQRLELRLASSLGEGIDRTGRDDVEVVFLDLGLPDSNGIDTFERFHAAWPRLPVLILTGISDAEVAVQAVQSGAQDYLVKGEVTGNLLVRAARYAIERKKTEEELRESESRFRQFFETIPEYCFMISAEGKVLDVNDAAVKALGYAKQELMGGSILEIYAPESRQKARMLLDRWEQVGRVENEEMTVQTSSGEKRFVLLSAGAARHANGSLFSTVSVQRDVTDMKRLEDQLVQAQKVEAIGRLAGGVAHDFNNLLGIITGYGELLRQSLADGHEAKKYLANILGAAERAAALTQQLLLFSRHHSKEQRIVDLCATTREFEKMLRRLIGEDVNLRVRTSAEPVTVRADTGQMEQVLMNLAVNARDAMEHGGTLTISVSSERVAGRCAWRGAEIPAAEYAVVEVADTGIGMDEDTLSRIFEPLFTTKAEGKGTGLGLATVMGIIRSHCGYIEVSSRPRTGTTVTLYLPRAGIEAEDQGAEQNAEGIRLTASVLLVEDEEALREIIAEHLRDFGCSVVTAAQGEQALDKAGEMQTLDMLVTDIVMPILNGVDLADRLAAFKPGFRALFISGYTDDELQRRARGKGGAGFLDKPFTPRTLAEKIKDTLELPPYGS